jgi:hypothetical protein
MELYEKLQTTNIYASDSESDCIYPRNFRSAAALHYTTIENLASDSEEVCNPEGERLLAPGGSIIESQEG